MSLSPSDLVCDVVRRQLWRQPALAVQTFAALELDPHQVAQIAADLEDAFDIDIPAAEIAAWKSVGDIVAFVERQGVSS
jgi:acyl carrier protein